MQLNLSLTTRLSALPQSDSCLPYLSFNASAHLGNERVEVSTRSNVLGGVVGWMGILYEE